MSIKLGIDVGGTFTDFLLAEEGRTEVHKTLSTPGDPSEGVLCGLEELARGRGLSLAAFAAQVETIVHGTTVTTNALLTLGGSTTGLLTTRGVRDALEMRRGLREEQYDNWYPNAPPLVPRRRRAPVGGRLDYRGRQLAPLEPQDVREAVARFRREGVAAVAICFLNSFANPAHEEEAARIVKEMLPEAYLSVSAELLPSIRFYERLSTTVLNAYVGPLLDAYLERLTARLAAAGFGGVLLVMQSNGGVVSPEVARKRAAVTLLSGPAAGPVAGLAYARLHGRQDCITMDMGGTSFDAAMVLDSAPVTATGGTIARYAIALPMLGIVTIGAGGGSIGWIDEGGLLRMGPQSAGSDPGPACYGRGGEQPTCTDADLVLGYLDEGYFAGGRLPLDRAAAERAIREKLALPLGLSVEEAAAGMYRLIGANMANGVREASVKKGLDPRDFLVIVAGGAGPNHACVICAELEVRAFLVPRDSSIFCAAGMLMSDLVHHLVRSHVCRLTGGGGDRAALGQVAALLEAMRQEGDALLARENVPADQRVFGAALDLRYAEQYHEVAVPITWAELEAGDTGPVRARFHEEHNRLYGYSLESEHEPEKEPEREPETEQDGERAAAPLELINLRVEARGRTDKPALATDERAGPGAAAAVKGRRRAWVPEDRCFREVPVYDGHALRHGNRLEGPALIEQVNTTTFVTRDFSVFCDAYGSFVVHDREHGGGLLGALERGGRDHA